MLLSFIKNILMFKKYSIDTMEENGEIRQMMKLDTHGVA